MNKTIGLPIFILPVLVTSVLAGGCSSSSDAGTTTGTPPDTQQDTAPPAPPLQPKVNVSFRVSGLTGKGLVVANGGDSVSVPDNGQYSFATALSSGATYDVTVATQPSSPAQTCTVAKGKGTADKRDVTDVLVQCTTDKFSVGGTVHGLSGTGLILENDFADAYDVSASGPFTFKVKLAPGEAYYVRVLQDPSGQTCTITNGSGVMGSANVSNVDVTCTP